MTDQTLPAEGMETPDTTQLGFGGRKIKRRLRIGDELYLLMKCEVSSETEKEDQNGKRSFAAGARTTILAELTAGEATHIAAQHGWTEEDDVDTVESDDLS